MQTSAKALVFRNNWVTSYLTTDLNTGNPLVVNLADEDSTFFPGYVARTVVDGVAHSYGEGMDPLQSEVIVGLGSTFIANELVWGELMDSTIAEARTQCACDL